MRLAARVRRDRIMCTGNELLPPDAFSPLARPRFEILFCINFEIIISTGTNQYKLHGQINQKRSE